ncbi:MAG: restriction endonuclease subunit R [Candidatus Saccharibacteria bacterium]|nr:restriction endonuclease subunit R [Candidatus Saccharibacteria bacterium]
MFGYGVMHIRTADISKRPFNLPEESIYAQFCDMVKRQAGIGSQDAMRKNLFVDLHRMGLIDRYDKHKKVADPYAKTNIRYVGLTQLGLRFINPETDLLGRQFIFTKAIDRLLKGFINVLLNIFREYPEIKTITLYELMFFVSGVRLDSNESFSFSIKNIAEAVSLMQSFNDMSLVQKRNVISHCESVLVPGTFKGNKTKQRDFHNWKNKIQQMFKLFEQTAYFRVEGSKKDPKLCLRADTGSTDQPVVFNRSAKAKQGYFEFHDVCKTQGFELHHVVPLSWAESPDHFLLLDNYKNMVYIDGYNHAKITQNRSRNVYMTNRNENLILS